jgi:putative ABC transport system substrate-binding protein
MMDRRTFLAISLANAVAAPLAATAQQTAKVWRIGYLSFTPGPSDEAFRVQLNEPGYVAGKNLVVEYRWASPDLDRYATLARELLDAGVDVIVAKSNRAVLAAKTVTGKIPIVGMTMLEPVESGIVKSLGRPGGNVTGLMWEDGPEQGAKKLEISRKSPKCCSYRGSLESELRGLIVTGLRRSIPPPVWVSQSTR